MHPTKTAGQLEPDAVAESETVRHLNDRLRTTGQGGRAMMTAGTAGLPRAEIAAVVRAVAVFDAFNADNDPQGEHRFHSPDAADPSLTTRVFTVMLADEY